MRFKENKGVSVVRFINSKLFIVAILLFSVFSTFAQENEAVVIDEVIAQVNEGVITLSRVKRELKDATDALVQQGKTPEAAKAEINNKQGELIANLINEELILQKAKELGLEKDIDAEVNRRFLEKTQELKLKSLEKLFEEMRKAGLNPEEIREIWRREITKGYVLQNEITRKIYINLNNKEVKEYFNKNKAKFIKPETVDLSEIFLSLAAADPTLVREKAKQLVAKARSGEDFAKLALENSERENIQSSQGKAGKYALKELPDNFSNPLRGVKKGGITDPIEVAEGIIILRVDERTAEATEATFDEDEVRRAIAYERFPDETKKYMIDLRNEAYIKISENYRAVVSPVLFEDERKAEINKKTSKK